MRLQKIQKPREGADPAEESHLLKTMQRGRRRMKRKTMTQMPIPSPSQSPSPIPSPSLRMTHPYAFDVHALFPGPLR